MPTTPYERALCRCSQCKAWVSVGPSGSRVCPRCVAEDSFIKGELEDVDMQAHMATLPVREDAPDEVQRFAQQRAAKAK